MMIEHVWTLDPVFVTLGVTNISRIIDLCRLRRDQLTNLDKRSAHEFCPSGTCISLNELKVVARV